MAKCECCGKGVTFGIKVSHSHRRSNRTWKPNVRRVKAVVEGSPKYIYACSLKVTELARYFGYNDKYLSSLFHEGTGMTLKQFILKSKMDSAMAELTDTNHTVSQIAYNVGFQDAHNFSTAFRKLTGMTPGQYRKSYGNRKLSFE